MLRKKGKAGFKTARDQIKLLHLVGSWCISYLTTAPVWFLTIKQHQLFKRNLWGFVKQGFISRWVLGLIHYKCSSQSSVWILFSKYMLPMQLKLTCPSFEVISPLFGKLSGINFTGLVPNTVNSFELDNQVSHKKLSVIRRLQYDRLRCCSNQSSVILGLEVSKSYSLKRSYLHILNSCSKNFFCTQSN